MTEKNKTKTEEKETMPVLKYALKNSHISEKASILAESGYYIFRVRRGANKVEIKDEVEKKYKVDILKVRTIKIPAKKIRVGRREGVKKSYKKAIVKVKEGQSIDITS